MPISDRTRLATAAAFLLVIGCHRGGNTSTAVVSGPSDPGAIACAPANASSFAKVCHLDREPSARGLILLIQKPDGGLRRLLVLPGGRGLVAADGADPASVSIVGDHEVEVTIGGDRFRLDAKLPPRAAS